MLVDEKFIGRWKVEFLESGKTAQMDGKIGLSSREEQLGAEVAELRSGRLPATMAT